MDADNSTPDDQKINLKAIRESWVWQVVLLPYFISRMALVLAAWFSGSFFQNLAYEKYISRGYFLTSAQWLDIWARWDSEWYLSIVENGYVPLPGLTETYSNLAFFPLYPVLVRLVSLVPGMQASRSVYLLIGILLSNIFFIPALFLLYRLVNNLTGDDAAARRTCLLVICFPAGFFFSCFYPTSLFLLLSLAAFTMAVRRNWLAAGFLGALLVITRPQGIVMAVPLAWMYMAARDWRFSKIRLDVLWLGLLPAAMLAHFYYIYRLTGDFFAIINVQGVWGRNLNSTFFEVLQSLFGGGTVISTIDSFLLALFLVLAIWALFRFKEKALGIYALLMVAMPLLTGTNISASRHMVTIFPSFMLLGSVLKSRESFGAVASLSFALQMLFMVGWVNYYWVA